MQLQIYDKALIFIRKSFGSIKKRGPSLIGKALRKKNLPMKLLHDHFLGERFVSDFHS